MWGHWGGKGGGEWTRRVRGEIRGVRRVGGKERRNGKRWRGQGGRRHGHRDPEGGQVVWTRGVT